MTTETETEIFPRAYIPAYPGNTAPRTGAKILVQLTTGENFMVRWCEEWQCWHVADDSFVDYDNDEWFGIGENLIALWAPVPILQPIDQFKPA